MVAASAEPVLSDEQLGQLLDANRTLDSDGLLATDEGWVPTYALGAAAQDGWLLKAGMVAGRVDGADGGMRLARSQLHAHCLAMADRYAARRSVSMPLAGPTERLGLPAFNVNTPEADGPGGMTQPWGQLPVGGAQE